MSEGLVTADDGVRLWVRDVGRPDAPAVVCCHGGPGIADYLEPIEAILAPEFRVIRWDQRGSGRSDATGPFSIARFVQDLDCVRSHFGLDHFVLFGHSWGANLAVHYGQRHPGGLRAIVYASGIGLEWVPEYSAIHKRRQIERLGPVLGARLAELRSKDRSPEEDREYRWLYIQSEQHDVTDRARAIESAEAERILPQSVAANSTINLEAAQTELGPQVERCRAILCPVLVLHGGSDPRPVQALDSMLCGLPQVELRMVENAGHQLWNDQPVVFAARLLDFIRRVPDSPVR